MQNQDPLPSVGTLGSLDGNGNGSPQKLFELIVNVNNQNVVFRIRFDDNSTSESLVKSIRKQTKIKDPEQFYIVDNDGLLVQLDGKMKEGFYFLKFGEPPTSDTIYEEEEFQKEVGLSEVEEQQQQQTNDQALDLDTESGIDEEKDEKLRKTHFIHGHHYVAKHYHVAPKCDCCKTPIFGVGKPGYTCKVCSINVHKRCHLNYIVKCGEDPESLPECENCRLRFRADENGPNACNYHIGAGNLRNGFCTKCGKMITPKNPGCLTGPHIIRDPDEKKKKKDSRKSLKKGDKLNGSGSKSNNNIDDDESCAVNCDCPSHYPNEVFCQRYTFSIKRIWEEFFGDSGNLNTKALLERRGNWDVEAEPWVDGKRKLCYMLAFMSAGVMCTETQTIEWRHEDAAFIIDISSSQPDVPYGTTFTVLIRYCITQSSTHTTTIRITYDVNYIKKSFVTAPFIMKGAKDGLASYLEDFTKEMERIQDIYMKETGTVSKTESTDSAQADQEKTGSEKYQISLTTVLRQPIWLSVMMLCSIVLLLISSWNLYSDMRTLEEHLLKHREKIRVAIPSTNLQNNKHTEL